MKKEWVRYVITLNDCNEIIEEAYIRLKKHDFSPVLEPVNQ